MSRERALQASKVAATNKRDRAAAKESTEADKGGNKWAALRDDYMIGEQLTVKVSAVEFEYENCDACRFNAFCQTLFSAVQQPSNYPPHFSRRLLF